MASLIRKVNDLTLMDTFTDPNLALTQVEELKPDIIFVDIEMPHKNGFEVVDQVRILGLKPTFVFTTGYDQFAVKAIKKEAFDYLLKPVTLSDILDIITRLKHQGNQTTLKESRGANGRLKFNTLNGFYIVEIEEVVYIQADGNYSELHMFDGTSKMVTSNLARVVDLLDARIFKRIGRSLIINTRFLTQVDRRVGKCTLHIGESEITLPISKKRIKDLADMFE